MGMNITTQLWTLLERNSHNCVHHCDAQFVYLLKGWVDLEFAGGDVIRVEAGDSLLIPGETPHNETATSDEFELLEVSVPADMGTSPCEAP